MSFATRLAMGATVGAILLVAGCATHGSQDALLHQLRSGLASARALPLGSRPAPPDIDLRNLKGLSKPRLLEELGEPTYCGDLGEGTCATSSPWKYEWGPPAPPAMSGDGFIEVNNGGPFVIELNFSGDTVSSARWLGQR